MQSAIETPAPDRLWRYIAYYGMSEAAQRATRIITTVMIARLLTPVELGIAATAITCFEIVRSIANTGLGQAVIRAPEDRLAGTCITAHRLAWIICLCLVAIQISIGAAIAIFSARADVFAMIAALSGVYLMMPPALIQAYLVQRAADHATVARVATMQSVADNALTVLMALAGFGAWAIVLPKLLTCPIWMFGMRRARRWTPDSATIPEPSRQMLRYALPLIAAELLTAARLQLDKVLVGAVLGIEALGVYYFVFNAGIGLSLSLTGALSNALYPHFAAASASPVELLRRLDHSLVRKALPIGGVILMQALMAPLYVPILFGAKWASSAALVAILCASASAKALADTSAQALRAAGATQVEFVGMLSVTVVSLLALAFGLQHGLAFGVASLAVTSATTQLAFALLARRHLALFGRRSLQAATGVVG